MADQEGTLRATLVLVQRVLRVEDRCVAQDVEVDRRAGDFTLLLAELLPARHQAFRQVVGDVEGEVAPHDGHARRGCERAGCLRACDDCELFEKLVLLREFLVVADVGLGEGNCELSFDIDGEVIAPDKHRDNRRRLASKCVIFDVLPCSSHRCFNDTVETVVHFHDEPLETRRLLVVQADTRGFLAARVGFSRIRRFGELIERVVRLLECLAEVTHDRANAVTVNMDHTN